MGKKTIKEITDQRIANTYGRFPLTLVSGSGTTVTDDNQNNYTDFVSGIAVCNIGHAHPKIAAAIEKQADALLHVSNLYYTAPQAELADWLVKNSFADRVFFANSGAESNEAAIKLARKFFAHQGLPQKHKIITMEKSFHGRTMATLSATGQQKVKTGFDPILEGFCHVPFNNIEALKAAIDESVCAVMLEPIQGEGGVHCPDPNYLQEVRALCDQFGILLIFDEIQTGMGRTGALFAYEHSGITPDIMTLAKALGNGLPIGAMLATEKTMSAFTPGSHASTFGGTPLIAAGALAVTQVFDSDNIVQKARETGAYFKSELEKLAARFPFIKEVRGLGLLLGMSLDINASSVVAHCQEHGFLINCIQDRILRFIPPLIISKEEIDGLITCLVDIFENTME